MDSAGTVSTGGMGESGGLSMEGGYPVAAGTVVLGGMDGPSPEPRCDDGIQNGGETDVDCGGDRCAPCDEGQRCADGIHCVSQMCLDQLCRAVACDDGALNGSETDIDCGGDSCGPCAAGLLCSGNGDCTSRVCREQVCRAASCDDGVLNGVEAGIDCGGIRCRPCRAEQMCQAGNDCIHGVCINGRCTEPRCGDGVQNGNEQCDDGNIVNNDGCEANCTLPTCGNGVIEPEEASCDCGPGLVNVDNNPDNGCECGLLANLDLSCDGVDDDCDGRVDEDYAPPAEIRGQCGQFDGPCDRSGVVAVTRRLCENGSVVEDNLEEVCARETGFKFV